METEREGVESGGDVINNLQSQLKSLQIRVKELELQNSALASQVSNCPQCRKLVESVNHSVVFGNDLVEETDKNEKCEDAERHTGASNRVKVKKSKDLSAGYGKTMRHHAKRYIALKVMYFGQRFHGFASVQVDPTIEFEGLIMDLHGVVFLNAFTDWHVEPSVKRHFLQFLESEIFKALERTKLMVGDRKESQYTRCGRTDKGVSSVGQVISLFLRSKYVDTEVDGHQAKASPENMCEEIDYVRVLNRVLPEDIRVISWCPAPIDFNARFSCLSREYKYLFWRGNLDISAMEMAGKRFVGEHDFRNFCKMDAMNVHNYRRNITFFEISIRNERSEGDQLWEITIKGSAFLWHQIRCMVAVLFMIGRGLESPSVIDTLLDIGRTPRKPQYKMAPELPLILRSCEFEGLKFSCSTDAEKALHEHLSNELRNYKLQAAIFQEALLTCSSRTVDENPLNNGKKVVHIPLMSRQTEPSYEERWVKLKESIAVKADNNQMLPPLLNTV